MADAIIAGTSKALISVSLPILISEIKRVYGETQCVQKELDKLEIKLSLIQDVLEDAERKQFQDRAVQKWLWRLRDVAYEAEDILDEWATKAQKQDHESQSRITQLCKCILPLFELIFRWHMAKKIKEIQERFVEIKEQSAEFHLMERVARTRKEVGESSRDPTDSLVDSSKIWGRDEDKKNMVELLLNGINSQEDIFVLPIVGMGGLGKTTLAQLVYKDPQVDGHFNLKMWVCVSENFELIRLTRDILESATRKNINLVTLNPLQESLQEELKGKKFLLVLDDVWNEDPEKWRRLKGILNCSKGSAIIVTTRIESIASMMGSPSQSYKLEGLSKDHCWSLFEQRAFGGESSAEFLNLVAIGKQIVKKCGGLPLAVNVLGSLLSSTRDEEEWKIIGDSEILNLPFHETGILPALRLSYDHLPFQLRRCFAYCSIFPKDYEIDKENLIYLWIANDFILPIPSMELEEVGNKIFNELVRRSLLQVAKRDRFEKIISCKMHDLLHDLARYVTGSEFFTLENEGEADGVPKETRHLFFDGKIIHKSLYDAHKVRGLFLTAYNFGGSLDLNQIVNLRLLRWLDLMGCRINEMPSSIDNMFHLRYLDLSWYSFTTLPESVSDLQNLQTLILRYCQRLTVLPEDMRKMCKLRYLDITGCNQLMAMPNKIGQLTGLRKLPTFVVGEGSDCGISQLGGMNLIRGELSIMRLERVRNGMHPQEAKLLFNKKNLRVLKLSWNEGLDDGEGLDDSEETLNSLQPCEKLEELEIISYPGNQFSSWLQASLLPYLLRVYLEKCNNCQSLPPLGQLPRLKHLSIKNMHAVKRIGVDFYGEDKSKSSFPLLQEFTLEGMDNLEEWSLVEDNREVFPCLNELTITNLSYFPEGLLRNCTKLKTLKLKRCQKLRTLGRDLDSLFDLESLKIDSCDEMECLSEEGIRGLSYLREVEILSCSKLTTISPGLEELPSLKRLCIARCKDLVSLPGGIGKLIHLESLRISSCTRLTSFPQEGIGGLTSLQDLTLQHLPYLTSLPEGIGGLVSLKKLEISNWHNLISLSEEGIRGLTALEVLNIEYCLKLSWLPAALQQLTSLRKLTIGGCWNLTSLPEEGVRGLTALEVLTLYGCSKLSKLPAALQHLTSLRELKIRDCENLTSLPEEGVRGLAALEKLHIDNCQKLSTLPAALQQLTSLRKLKIWDCENLTSLPEEGVRGLTALEVLDLRGCSKLSKLPAALQQLTSPRELKIRDCENLTSLPEEGVRGLTALEVLTLYGCSKLSKLPAALQHLTIQRLDIRDCHPELMTQVERKTGEEWLKIAHIPNIRTPWEW